MNFMRDLVSTCVGLPLPLRFVLLLIVGGGSASMLGYMLSSFMGMGHASWIVVGGIFVVVLLIVGFAALVKWHKRRKANPMERDIMGQAAAAPTAVSAASRRAMLDDLRRNFEGGIGKFRAAGKNLYSLPWYVIVGEPGSGKTEAVRHSCIGFPAGLHDPLQGAGGTINMNWWFTDRAVILDTAGRLMFEEVPAGTTSEWQEFLRLLRTYRHNCPVNGLVLVIPADTLITDNADQIKAKANKIAEQLHLIQRILEVRFPVFVMITKCDLINGFREFFDNVSDPDLQQQILGWSSPAPLDDHFRPEQVSEHLEVVCDRLRRRRLGLMIDPVHTEDPNGHRVDQVDALYALPQSLARIAPRLRFYLDHVFAGGEWTGKPLFLRGIYFTSSMREGAALDEELAEALGVPVQSIQEGREWEREKSYFLKDLFIEKIFKEKGLVTRAVNAGRQARRRQAIVLVAGFLSVLILAGLTWFGAKALRESIGVHRDYWVAAADPKGWRSDDGSQGVEYWQPIVSIDSLGITEYIYGGHTQVKVGGDAIRVAEFHGKLAELAGRPIRVPWVFFLARLGKDLTKDRGLAQQLLFERGVLRPLADAVRQKMLLPDDRRARDELLAAGWPDEFTPALAGLIRIEAPAGELPDLDPLIKCALHRRAEKEGDDRQTRYLENYELYTKDRDGLADALRWMYDKERQESGQTTPREAAAAGTQLAYRAIDDGVQRYIRHRAELGRNAAKRLDSIKDLTKLILSGYNDTEKRLIDTDDDFALPLERSTKKEEVIKEALAAWENRLAALEQVKAKAESQLAALTKDLIFPIFQSNVNTIFKEVAEAFERFREQAAIKPPVGGGSVPREGEPGKTRGAEAPPTKEQPEERGEVVEKWRALAATINKRLDNALEELKKIVPAAVEKDVRRVDDEFLTPIDLGKAVFDRLVKDGLVKGGASTKLPLYAIRHVMYLLGNAERGKRDAAAEIASLRKGIEAVEAAVKGACAQVAELRDIKPEAFRFKDASEVSVFAADKLAMPQRIYTILFDALKGAPDTPEKVAAEVEKASAGLGAMPRPKIAATGFKGGAFEAKYHPDAVRKVIGVCREAGEVLADPKRNILNRERLEMMRVLWQGVVGKYITGPYLGYWTQTVPRDLDSHGEKWAAFRQEVERSDIFQVFLDLGEVGGAMLAALHSEIELSLAAESRATVASARETINNQLRKLKNDIYMGRCRTVRGNWTKLGDDPFKARIFLAPLSDDEIFENYIPFEAKAPEELADKYWTSLTLEFLRLLADEASEYGRTLVKDLRARYSRFPLDRPAPKDEHLTAPEVGEARKIVETLVLQWKETPAPAVGPAADPLKRFREAVRKMIDEIRKLRIPPPDWDWVQKVKGVLDGLPTGDRALKCELWVPAVQPSPTAAHRWVHIRVKQGDKEIGKGNTLPAADYKLCDVWYPGDKLEIRLYRNPVDPEPNRGIDVKNLWAMVRLLHPGGLTDPLFAKEQFKHAWDAEKPIEKKEIFEPAKRNVMLNIEDDQRQTRPLRLRLEFEKGLPRIEDWPTSQPR